MTADYVLPEQAEYWREEARLALDANGVLLERVEHLTLRLRAAEMLLRAIHQQAGEATPAAVREACEAFLEPEGEA